MVSTDLSNIHVKTTITSVRPRLLAMIDLQKRLDSLSHSKLSQPELIPVALSSHFPVRVVSKLGAEQQNSMAEYTRLITNCGVVDSDSD